MKGVVVRGGAVFAGPEKEEEGQPRHIDCSSAQGAGLDDGLGPVENLDGKRFDTRRGGVIVGIGRIQGGQPRVHVAKSREPGILEAH